MNEEHSQNYLSLSGEKLDIDITIHNPEWEVYLEDIKQNATIVVEAALSAAKYNSNGKRIVLAIVLAEKTFVADLNTRFRDQPHSTNVLSFPQDDFVNDSIDEAMEYAMLGDIVFDYVTIAKEAQDKNKSLINHFYHLLVHGLLHLIGHDHVNEIEANLMEQLEIDILAQFSIESPY